MSDEIEKMRPENFYDEYGEDEWERLEANIHHRIEFESTIHYLEEHLPDSGRILDAGGGAGRYSIWLAEMGYKVVLLDISEEQLKIAEEKAEEHDVKEKITFVKGDLTDMEFQAERFDGILCTGGPLSHIVEEGKERRLSESLKG